MKANIEVIEDKLYVGAVADEIIASIRDVITERGRCSLVLAGGSTPSAIYRALTKPPRDHEIDWNKVDFFWGDERWVGHDHVQSNFRMVNETLLSPINVSSNNIHAVDTSLQSAAKGAEDYAKTIRKVLKIAENQLPKFDLVLLGIGEDGHTASIFPNSKTFDIDPLTICAAVDHPDGSSRITILPDALFSARRILFIVKGDSKASIVKQVINGNDSEKLIPSRLFLKAQERVTFFLDSSSASMLDV
jgi:6-phosphogluconolactonase